MDWRSLRNQPSIVDRQLVRRFYDIPPINSGEIAERLNIEVNPVSSPGWMGASRFNTCSAFIWYDKALDSKWRRFIIAVGIGHVILDEPGTYSEYVEYQQSKASEFAVRLLMPKRMIFPVVQITGYDPPRISLEFGVPEKIVDKRLEMLFG